MKPQEMAEKIQNALIKAGMTQKQFAERAGLQECVISDIMHEKRSRLHFKTVSKILEAIKQIEGRHD